MVRLRGVLVMVKVLVQAKVKVKVSHTQLLLGVSPMLSVIMQITRLCVQKMVHGLAHLVVGGTLWPTPSVLGV